MSSIAISAVGSPITYNITFTTNNGIAPTSGSFTYDAALPPSFPRFSNFNVIWDGSVFNFTAAANTGETFFGTDCGTIPSPQSVFMILSGENFCVHAATITWNASMGAPGLGGIFGFFDLELAGFGPPSASIMSSVLPGGGNDNAAGVFLIAPVASVPEPATFPLVLSCFGLLSLWGRACLSKAR